MFHLCCLCRNTNIKTFCGANSKSANPQRGCQQDRDGVHGFNDLCMNSYQPTLEKQTFELPLINKVQKETEEELAFLKCVHHHSTERVTSHIFSHSTYQILQNLLEHIIIQLKWCSTCYLDLRNYKISFLKTLLCFFSIILNCCSAP